ncbi:MAG: FAD-binding oxidoreductase [Actinomycetota bacterium]|nr:FAD-binding oxidoreductase [Actinomycetota bacterium]
MTPPLPAASPYVVLGGGVHGLSTAYHLALELERNGTGSGEDVVVLEKSRIGAGASGIACGVVRNFYFSPPMAEVIRVSVELFEADPEGFGYHSVGYIAAVPEVQAEDCVAIQRRQAEIGYRSEVVLGARACREHMQAIFPDWNGDGIEAVLHEYQGGWADTRRTVENLARLARSRGVRILEGVEVTGIDLHDGEVQAVETDRGSIRTELFVSGPGPWAGSVWRMLELADEVRVASTAKPKPTSPIGDSPRVEAEHGEEHELRPIVTYWKLQEGDYWLDDGNDLRGPDGREPPVVHLDHVVPLRSDRDGHVIEDGAWGIYYKLGRRGFGVQGGGVPIKLGTDVELEPYGHGNPAHVVGDEFSDYFTAGLAWAHERFRGRGDEWHAEPHGGIGAFTPDNYPVVDYVRPNAYVIMDSNHGFKMIGLGKLVARDIVGGGEARLEPFRLARFDSGVTHAVSRSPYPWN